MSRENSLTRLLISELRCIRDRSLQPRFEQIGDVHQKCGPHIVVERRVDDLEGPMHGNSATARRIILRSPSIAGKLILLG